MSKNEEAMTKLNSNKQQENTVREELHKKYEQYAQMLVDLEQKQQELAKVTIFTLFPETSFFLKSNDRQNFSLGNFDSRHCIIFDRNFGYR